MSYGINVWSKSEKILDRKQIREKMRGYGWEILFQQGFSSPTIAVEGPVEDEIIVGWRPDDTDFEHVRRAIESSDRRALDFLYESEALVGCEIWVENPYDIDPGELEEMAEHKSPEEIEIIRAARSRYSVSTSAGQGPDSMEFQEYAARSIAELTDGWVEDPQSGESGTVDEIGMPTPWQGPAEASGGRTPWYSIALYSLFAVMGLLAFALGRYPLSPSSWLPAIFFLLGVVAFGLYQRAPWARIAGLGISAFLLILSLTRLVSDGVNLDRLIPILIHGAIIRELLDPEVRAYFE